MRIVIVCWAALPEKAQVVPSAYLAMDVRMAVVGDHARHTLSPLGTHLLQAVWKRGARALSITLAPNRVITWVLNQESPI